MTESSWTEIVSAVTIAVGVIAALIKQSIPWFHRLSDAVNLIVLELTNNGGSSAKDILQRMDSRMRFVERRADLFLSALGVGIARTDASGGWTAVNRSLMRQTGRSTEELLGRGWLNAILKNDRISVSDSYFSAIQDKREFELRAEWERPDGYKVSVQMQAWPTIEKSTAEGYIFFSRESSTNSENSST